MTTCTISTQEQPIEICLKSVFIFAMAWSLGGHLHPEDRVLFDKWIKTKLEAAKISTEKKNKTKNKNETKTFPSLTYHEWYTYTHAHAHILSSLMGGVDMGYCVRGRGNSI